jgi:hypothetical protein
MLTTIVSALLGAGGLGAILTPVLLHLTSRRVAVQTENAALIDALQEERDAVVARLDQRDATIVKLWDYVLELRYSIVKGTEPPTMPETLSINVVRARMQAAT